MLHQIRRLCLSLLLVLSAHAAQAAGDVLRVAVLSASPPVSYIDGNGKLAGFNIDIAHALCEAMEVRCELHVSTLDKVIDAVAAGEYDIAVVSLLATPERRRKVLFSKPYYRSTSVWFAPAKTAPETPGVRVAAVRGSAQAAYAQARGWSVVPMHSHDEMSQALASGAADAALVPMLTALALRQHPAVAGLGLTTTVLADAALSGDVCISIAPRYPALRTRVDAAIDRIKRDGRYDRINTQHLPFKLQ